MKPSKTQRLNFDEITKEVKEVMNCEEVRKIRHEMLSDNLPNFCKGCMMLKEYSTPKEFAEELKSEGCINKVTDNINEMCQIDQVNELYFEITTKCNLKCIYCLHSTVAFKDWIKELGIEKFFVMLEVLVEQWNVQEISTTGIGEFTLVEGWTQIVCKIKTFYPNIRISLFSNFAKNFSNEEISALANVDKINVSCDTVNDELFKFLRSGELGVLLNNLDRLNAERKKRKSNLMITIAAVVNSSNINYLEELLDYIIQTKCAEELNLTPMTLPMVAAKSLGVYPIQIYANTEEKVKISNLLKNLYEKGRKEGINVNWSGDLQNFWQKPNVVV